MLDWSVRWGVPLTLLFAGLVFADGRLDDPSAFAQQALDVFRSTLVGMIPKFF
ncbi:MAG: hypothetical protein ACT4QC_19225 [Planctomycetaceae bacterium]